jgi:hypothetical protein
MAPRDLIADHHLVIPAAWRLRAVRSEAVNITINHRRIELWRSAGTSSQMRKGQPSTGLMDS